MSLAARDTTMCPKTKQQQQIAWLSLHQAATMASLPASAATLFKSQMTTLLPKLANFTANP
jgi:hypothetical protein